MWLEGGYAPDRNSKLQQHDFDREALGHRSKPYERLDQLAVEILLGVR